MPSPPLHEPMSLFQAREFWSAATGTEEEFGGGCLAIANLDNDPGGQLKIATGSFSGMLRLYFPREREFKLEDLMLEQDMERPILQLLAGRYLPDSERVAYFEANGYQWPPVTGTR